MEYGFISGESATVRMLSRLLAALPKESPDGASDGEVVRGEDEGERGRAEPDPETEKRLLRESTPVWGRGDAGRERKLGGCDVAETSSLDPFCCGLFVSSAELKVALTGEGSIPCIRMESITSKSPRGSGAPDELDGIPKPALTDLQDRVMRKVAKDIQRGRVYAHLWPRTAFLIALIQFCDSFVSTICSNIIVKPFSSPFKSRRRAPTSTPPTRTTPRRPPTSSPLTNTTLRSFISRRSISRSSEAEDLNMCKCEAPVSTGALRTTWRAFHCLESASMSMDGGG